MKKLLQVLFRMFCIDFRAWKKQDTSHLPRFPKVTILQKNEPVDGVYTVCVETYWDRDTMRSHSNSEVRVMTCTTTPLMYTSLSVGQIAWVVPSKLVTTRTGGSVVAGRIPVTFNASFLRHKISMREISADRYLDILGMLHFKRNTLPWLKAMT